MKIDFNKDIDFESKEELTCKLNDEDLTFIDYERYIGPCTMQYLPNGGILCLFNNTIIIQVKNGILGVTKVKYKDKVYTSKEFIDKFEDLPLVNEILH